MGRLPRNRHSRVSGNPEMPDGWYAGLGGTVLDSRLRGNDGKEMGKYGRAVGKYGFARAAGRNIPASTPTLKPGISPLRPLAPTCLP